MAAIESSDLLKLVEPLVSGIVEQPLWRGFLDRLRERVIADYVSLVFRPLPEGTPEARVIHLYSGQPSPEPVSQFYRDSLYKDDPMPYQDMAEARVYRLDELLRLDDQAHVQFRADLLVPSGMNVLRMMRVAEASGVNAWLTVTRRRYEFTHEDDALIGALAPFMRVALQGYVAIERERMKAQVANEAMRRMNFGWLALDTDGAIIEADSQTDHLIEQGGLLRRNPAGQLEPQSGTVRREIKKAVQQIAAQPNARPRAIVLQREPWLDMLLVASNMHTGTTRAAPAAIAYIHADNWSSADRCEQLGDLFDLIPSEARLALALSRGMSIAEAAEELGLTVESARTYSKKIYAKTGARGQADLVRFVHRSVLAIA